MSLDLAVNPFQKGVVTAIYLGPQSLPEFSAQLAAAKISVTPERIPRNSVIVRRVTRGADSGGSSFSLCYPFFSSHISLPVKPAEVVWVIFDRDTASIGYWIGRVHGDATAEDVNYSHFDRNFTDAKQKVTTSQKAGSQIVAEDPDDFPNMSLAKKSGSNDYDLILSGASYSYSHTALEPVPRFFKNPGDLVIQGSNNATISLMTDRGWATSVDPTSLNATNASVSPKTFTGAIDIVTGRSRWLSNAETGRTIPTTRANRRNFQEVAKRMNDVTASNPTEGDVDFLDDASRVYVSSNTKVDYNFGTSEFTPSAFVDDTVPKDCIGASVAVKADEIRLIARNDEERNVTGSVRIIKEGTRDDNLVAIVMLPDGTLQLSAKEIHLGRSPADGGLQEGDSDAPGTSQPYVKYKQLEDLLKAIIADIKSFCDTVNTHTTPGFGAPSPQLNQAVTTLKSAMETRESEIPTIRSKRIFGE